MKKILNDICADEIDLDCISKVDLKQVDVNSTNSIILDGNRTSHVDILNQLLQQVIPLDFKSMAFPEIIELKRRLTELQFEGSEAKDISDKIDRYKLTTNHFMILAVQNIIDIAASNNWGLCKNLDFIFIFNGTYWSLVEDPTFEKFLGEAAEKMGVDKFLALHYQFRTNLLRQFKSTGFFPTPEPDMNSVLINLENGTFELKPNEMKIRPYEPKDFLTYKLPFEYNPKAEAVIFQQYLDKVLPDIDKQKVLAEYLGYIFIKHGSKTMKEEKALILYGSGANGKSVFFEIVNSMLGMENVSNYSLQDLTNESGYYRAMIANKLVNYGSEINGKLETAIFKQIVSGEPISARLPYGRPIQIRQYAKLIFNCNELPKDIEHTNAYFRRFLIIPFDVTIAEHEQDKSLHSKIIESELSGVFNWVLQGLSRLLEQKHFTYCHAAEKALAEYKLEADSLSLFLSESQYVAGSKGYTLLKYLYSDYLEFCNEDGFKPLRKLFFIKRLRNNGIHIERRNVGYLVNVAKSNNDDSAKKDIVF